MSDTYCLQTRFSNKQLVYAIAHFTRCLLNTTRMCLIQNTFCNIKSLQYNLIRLFFSNGKLPRIRTRTTCKKTKSKAPRLKFELSNLTKISSLYRL